MRLLERSSFLRTLAEYATEASDGDGRLVLVSGESGMGKTALLEAFQHEQPGTRWLWGACDGLFTPRPLGPLFDIGAQLDGERGQNGDGEKDGQLATLCREGAARDRLFAALLTELDAHPPVQHRRDRGRATGRTRRRSTCSASSVGGWPAGQP